MLSTPRTLDAEIRKELPWAWYNLLEQICAYTFIALHNLINIVTVGTFFPRSMYPTYSRDTFAFAASCSWVSPAAIRAFRSSSLSTAENVSVDLRPVRVVYYSLLNRPNEFHGVIARHHAH